MLSECNLEPDSCPFPRAAAMSEKPAGFPMMTAAGGYVIMTPPKIPNRIRDIYMTPMLEIDSEIYESSQVVEKKNLGHRYS